jgi:hypothetical protein
MLRGALTSRRIRTAVYGVFVAFAAVFVVFSTRSIIWGVFAIDAENVLAPAGRACGEKIAGLAAALDRGVAATSAARTEPEALARMHAALAPEWDAEPEIAAACAQDPRGADAWAALLRLKRAEEGAAGRRAALTGPMHRELEVH